MGVGKMAWRLRALAAPAEEFFCMDSERGSPVIQFFEVQGPLLASMGTHVCMGVYTYACMRLCVCVCAHIYPDRERQRQKESLNKNLKK